MKHFIIILSYFVLSSYPCLAQTTFEGFVTGAENNPVPYTTVSLNAMDSALSMTTQADSTGHFVFKNLLPRQYQLSAYSLGYTNYTLAIHVRKDTAIHIILKPLEGTLEEVTVIGNKPVIERKADRIIYHVANSINAVGSNGLEVLSKTPGIKTTDNMISLAGKGALSVMINGRLLHLSGEALVRYLKSFSSGQISSIEIITHASAEYDAEGNAGLVNIITKRSTRAGFSGNIQGTITRFIYTNQPDYKGIKNYGDLNGNLGLNYNNNKWSAYSDISYTTGRELWGYGIDVYYPEKHWAMKDTGEYSIATFNLLTGADYKLSNKTTLGLEYLYNYHMEDGADYVRVPVYNIHGKTDSVLKTIATYYPIAQSNSFNLHLIQQLNSSEGKLALNADYFNSYRHDRSDLETNSYTAEGKPNPGGIKRYYDTTLQNIRIYTFKADMELPTPFASFSLGSKVSFINNYSNIYYYNKVNGALIPDNDLSNEFRYIENTQALYGNGTKVTGKWKIEAGLRAEMTRTKAISYFQDQKINQRYLKLFPSLLASFEANDKNSVSLSYNKRIHRPTFWNLNPYKTLMTAYTYVEGNPYLEPEYITNIDLSHTYKNMLTSSLYMNVTNNGFAQVIRPHSDDDYIHTTTLLNFITAHRYGISESVSVSPFRWLESNNQVNAYYTRVRSGLSYINDINGPGLYVATHNTITLNRDKTIMAAVDFWCQFPETDHFGRSDTYYQLDIGFKILALQKKLSLSLNATDLLESSGSIIHTTVNNIRETFTNFQIYRNIKFSAAWRFGNNNQKQERINTGNEAERSRLN